MAGKRPPPQDGAPAAGGEQPRQERAPARPAQSETRAGAERAAETCGPVLLERHRKDDGRALILYRRRPEQA